MEIKADHTVRKILKWVLIVMAVALILLWFLGGGVGKVADKVRGFNFFSLSRVVNSSTSTISTFHLPWEIAAPQISVQGVSDMYPQDGSDQQYVPPTDDTRPPDGAPSPYAGKVSIQPGAAQTQSATGQYIELYAAPGNGVAIPISGWTLQSAISGTRVVIPQATSRFIMGSVNAVATMELAPGSRAIVVSGASPVGVSFRENMCTGYLGTLQPFVPPLAPQCPRPLSSIPETSDNISRFGSSCFAYLHSLPPCTFPQNPPDSLTPACRTQIQNTLSYSGCVSQNKSSPNFYLNSWRIYLAYGAPLWGAQHDIVRLLDSEGRTVNVLNY